MSKIKQSPKRVAAFRSTMEKAGGKLVGLYYTYGKYDGMLLVEARIDETVMSALLAVGSKGNVRTVTLKAFTEFEATKIFEQLRWAHLIVSSLSRKMLIIILCL